MARNNGLRTNIYLGEKTGSKRKISRDISAAAALQTAWALSGQKAVDIAILKEGCFVDSTETKEMGSDNQMV